MIATHLFVGKLYISLLIILTVGKASNKEEKYVRHTESDGYPQHGAIGLPTYGLLVPKAGHDAKESNEHTDGTEDGLAMTAHTAATYRTVAYAVVRINVQSQ